MTRNAKDTLKDYKMFILNELDKKCVEYPDWDMIAEWAQQASKLDKEISEYYVNKEHANE